MRCLDAPRGTRSTGPLAWLVPLLRRSRDVVVQGATSLGTFGTGVFNCLHPPFGKPAVRRAILRAMSQQDFMSAAAGAHPSLWHTGVGVFTPETPLATQAGIEALTARGDITRSREELCAAAMPGKPS
ncbi:MAG: transporter substrate-binding protein [Rhodospirillales bacterium]|jgi:peptide/nickel transport system substrate-binding protein|nr:transporter substrate-binding protein [Rhodospirillales bacterium]